VTAALWIIGGWVAASALFAMGWACGHRLGHAKAADECQRFEALCDDWETQFEALQVELGRADATILRLTGNVEVLSRNVVEAYKSGQVDGQMFQAERREHGL
jgi:hypothetical protein